MGSDIATKPGACDVCAGRAEPSLAAVTCSQHFIDALFPEDAPRAQGGDSAIFHRQYGEERGL